MKHRILKETRITFTLNDDEAKWLKDCIQNTRYDNLEDEPKEETKMRLALFNALKEVED